MPLMENSTGPIQPATKRVKHRSPSYPTIDLAKALQRAQQLRDRAGKHPAPLESAFEAWGYSAKSSSGLQAVSSLKQYGLIEDSGTGGSRQVVLTKAAQELLVYGANSDSQEFKERVKAAALRPKVHDKLWRKYDGELPDDSVMLPFLKLDLGFSDEAALDMLKSLHATFAFADISNSEPAPARDAEEDSPDVGEEQMQEEFASETEHFQPQHKLAPNPGLPAQAEQRTVQVTYSPSAWALVQAPFPMSPNDWDAFVETLNGMKRGLVKAEE
jgi:hypothetical protein